MASTAILNRAENSVRAACEGGLLVAPPQGVLSGFSGEKLVGLLQRLVSNIDRSSNSCYLEVGVFQGLTLLSTALANKEVECFGVDNFAFFDAERKNLGIVERREKELALSNVHIVNCDYEDALEDIGAYIGDKKIAVYFVDGPHDYRSQLMCLQLALPHLSEDAVIVIDDCNYRHVRQANRDFLKTNAEFRLLFEAYTPCHPMNMKAAEHAAAREGWWNGVNVLVRDPSGAISQSFPPTERSRDLFENEHLIHSARYGFCGPESVEVVGAAAMFRPIAFAKAMAKLVARLSRRKADAEAAHLSANTYSANLPAERLAPRQ